MAQTSPTLLLKPEVLAKTRLSAATLWRQVTAGKFPQPVKIGERRVAWRTADVDCWMASLPQVKKPTSADGSEGA
jgi:prophage regulatory protein